MVLRAMRVVGVCCANLRMWSYKGMIMAPFFLSEWLTNRVVARMVVGARTCRVLAITQGSRRSAEKRLTHTVPHPHVVPLPMPQTIARCIQISASCAIVSSRQA